LVRFKISSKHIKKFERLPIVIEKKERKIIEIGETVRLRREL